MVFPRNGNNLTNKMEITQGRVGKHSGKTFNGVVVQQ